MTKLILIGAGGHSKVIQDIVTANEELELYAVVDDAFNAATETNGIIYANTSLLDSLSVSDYLFAIAIGSNNVRKRLYEKLNIPIERYATLIHPSAVVSESARIGYGTVIMPNAVVNAYTTIGNHCIVNTNATVEHDNRLGDYVHVSPGATLSGTVKIDEGTHIGSGAVVIPNRNIGSWSVIGAGGVVVTDVESNITVVGVPAKIIE